MSPRRKDASLNREMNPFLTSDQCQLKSEVRRWVEETLYRRIEQEPEEETRQMVRLLAERGWLACVAETSQGGRRDRVSARDLCVVREELARGSSLADFAFAMQGLGSYPITIAGSPAQKERYLRPVVRGEHLAAFAITEPEAGSDVAALQTQAQPDGDDYVITGVKRFISNAGIAQTYVVFARTMPREGPSQISAFVVDGDTPGFLLRAKTPLMSPHPLGEIAFDHCRVPRSLRLGREGEGLAIAFKTLDLFRCTVGAAAVGMAQRALDEGLEYARRRRQFGRSLAEFQAIQFKLAQMAVELEAARLLVYQAAWKHDTAEGDAAIESAMAKLYATEAAQRVIDQSLQIHGGTGVVVGTPVERLYRDIRALRIYEGTSEIQHLIIARHLLLGTDDNKS